MVTTKVGTINRGTATGEEMSSESLHTFVQRNNIARWNAMATQHFQKIMEVREKKYCAHCSETPAESLTVLCRS
jgi:hypothetical protein